MSFGARQCWKASRCFASNDPYGYLNKSLFVRACGFIHIPNHRQDQALNLVLILKCQLDAETPFVASSDLQNKIHTQM